jgi:hypothetical protein
VTLKRRADGRAAANAGFEGFDGIAPVSLPQNPNLQNSEEAPVSLFLDAARRHASAESPGFGSPSRVSELSIDQIATEISINPNDYLDDRSDCSV